MSTLAFIVILGRFFSHRIRGKPACPHDFVVQYADRLEEEKFLVRFFGDDYVQYRKRVGTGLPFMISQS